MRLYVQATFIIVRDDIALSLDVTGDVDRDGVTVDDVYYTNTSTRWPGELTDSELGDAQDALWEEAQWG